MTTIALQIPDKFKSIIATDVQLERITSYFIDDYLTELYQDARTKAELENNEKDEKLSDSLSKYVTAR